MLTITDGSPGLPWSISIMTEKTMIMSTSNMTCNAHLIIVISQACKFANRIHIWCSHIANFKVNQQ